MNFKIKNLFGVGSPIRFIIVGIFGMIINLTSFSIYISFFSATISSFFAFSTAVSFNFIGHRIYLWEIKNRIPLLRYFRNFYSGYSFSLLVNLLTVYFFESYFTNKIYIQIIGIIFGSVLNYFVSRAVFKKKAS